MNGLTASSKGSNAHKEVRLVARSTYPHGFSQTVHVVHYTFRGIHLSKPMSTCGAVVMWKQLDTIDLKCFDVVEAGPHEATQTVYRDPIWSSITCYEARNARRSALPQEGI
jgi:hypothetical protein